MRETLYRPHAAEGTHFCENQDLDGWLKGSTLDDETNKVHGTLNLEPVDVDLDENSDAALYAAAGAAVVFGVWAVWENRGRIKSWVSTNITRPMKVLWNNLRGRYSESDDIFDDNSEEKIIDIRDYLPAEETQDSHTDFEFDTPIRYYNW